LAASAAWFYGALLREMTAAGVRNMDLTPNNSQTILGEGSFLVQVVPNFLVQD